MELKYQPPTPKNNIHTYCWTNGSQRPAKPPGHSQALIERFLESHYAKETTLAEFLRAHRNALTGGVLNQLHRRHIISWDLIKEFNAKAATFGFNKESKNLTGEIFAFFDNHNRLLLEVDRAQGLKHGNPRAQAWAEIAKHMCWVENNVFVGPSAGNNGTRLDQGDELTDRERRDLLVGTAWQAASKADAAMRGFCEHRREARTR